MEPELQKSFEEQDKKLDAIYKSTERTRKIFMWTLIISLVMIILPLIGLIVIIPQFLGTLDSYQDLIK